jgi:ubiquinone/menaquinone biosynthesis C-methylase UbiE
VSAQDAELQDRFFGQIYKAMGISTDSIVADIGTGDRPVHALRMEKIVGPSGKIVCVDIDEKAVTSLRKSLEAEDTPNITAQLGKENDPMLPGEAFDAVLISNAYHEMEEHQSMLEHVRQALKPGGNLVIVESIAPKRRRAPRLEQTAAHELAPDLVDAELRLAGFKIVSKIEPLMMDGDTVKYLIVSTPIPGKP